MLPNFANSVFGKKGWTIPHEKCTFLLDMDFLVNEIADLISNFVRRKACILSNG
jgi:hypothetical protein